MATTQPTKKTAGGLGKSDTKILKEMFRINPLDDYDPEKLMNELLDSVVTENDQTGPIDMNYGQAPDIENFVPNISSPGPGSSNPNDQAEPPPGPFPSSGFGSTTEPVETAPKVAAQKIKRLKLGKSS